MIVKECPVCKRTGTTKGGRFVPMLVLSCDQCSRLMCGACWEKHAVKVHGVNLNEIRGEHIPRSYMETPIHHGRIGRPRKIQGWLM